MMKAYSKGASIGSQVETYIRSLRNKAKKQYANDYAIHLINPNPFGSPDAPGLSCMGAQAVRHRILAIVNNPDY